MVRCIAAVLIAGFLAAPAQAEIVRLEIRTRESANGGAAAARIGPYEIIRGIAHGELDPRDAHNVIIQDIGLAPRNARGKVEYAATFALAVPVDRTKAARVLLYQVVNRGNGQVTLGPEGYISLISGWQGDLQPSPSLQTIAVPVATQPDGSPITGPVLARFVDVPTGTHSAPIRLSSMGTTAPQYPAAGLAQPEARLTMHASETTDGVIGGEEVIARTDWALADCERTPFPGTPDPTRLCLRAGFRGDRVYELVYTARDPLVLGVGLAATRDLVAFFRYAKADATGAPNPVAGLVDHAVSIGDSQSGNFIRTFIHLGFNQDERRRLVWDGAFPRIAARQTPINFRFALPGGAATLYEPGSEGVLWWTRYDDRVRGLAPASLLDRCTATGSCPKIIEAFGSTEFWGLRMSPGLIGTDARGDIPLPANVRRYYYPSTHHGGGRGGFQVEPSAATGAPRCELPDNPNPESDQTRALTRALVEWVTRGVPPPESRYPLVARGELVAASRDAIGMPAVPGLPFSDRILNPMLHYQFGSGFSPADVSGVINRWPPRVQQVIPTYVPRVNADGNETVGVPSVLLQAPLGTYLGWNVTRGGFFAGSGCGFAGGYVPFARTEAERERTRDPRPSVEARYGTLEGYVCRVRQAADAAVRERFLLPDDAARLVREAAASRVLPLAAESSPANRSRGDEVCR